MIRVYAVVLALGLIALVAWILMHVRSLGVGGGSFDPEQRFGLLGRRVIAGSIGFSMAGLSAEFSPRDLSWPLALALAAVGAAVLAWYAGRPMVRDGAAKMGPQTTEASD